MWLVFYIFLSTEVSTLQAILEKYYDLKSVKGDLLLELQAGVKDPKETTKIDLLIKDGVSLGPSV